MNNTTPAARWLIHPATQEETAALFSRPLGTLEAGYLETVVEPLLRKLEEKDYVEGAQGILRTLARYAYVLKGENIDWCIEWGPGLLVVEFAPRGTFRWCALRSPDPQFGGRQATQEEIDSYDEDQENPQYNLVFKAWDAQCDPLRRQGWTAATADEIHRWERAMARANEISRQTQALSSEEQHQLLRRCQASSLWQGTIAHG